MPATLNFAPASTDKKVFTPITAALSNLPNSGGTIVAMTRQLNPNANHDIAGLTNAATSAWYHAMSVGGNSSLNDDDGLAGSGTGQLNGGAWTSTDWFIMAVTWPTGGAALGRGHAKDVTTGTAWVHSNAGSNNGGNRAGPGTTGWMRLGHFLDSNTNGFDFAWAAAFPAEFSDTDFSSVTWAKTSDVWNHPKGRPVWLVEGTSSTPVDLTGNSTYSSANSTGTTLTGSSPPWTFDQTGAAVTLTPIPVPAGAFTPHLVPASWF